MGFTQYIKRVLFRDSNGNGYVIPVSNLEVWYEPWHSTGDTFVRLFHGAHVQRIQGYQGMCSFDMNFGHMGTDDATLSSFLNAVSANTTMIVDFDPDADPGNKTMTVILDDVRAGAGADFSGKIRNRRVKLKFIDPLIRATIPQFIVGATGSHELLDVNDLILLLPQNIVEDPADSLSVWTNVGLILTDGDLVTLANSASFAFDDITTDPSIGRVAGLLDNDTSWGTAGVGVVPTVEGANDDSELWIIMKTGAAGNYGQICSFTDGGGSGSRWQETGGKFSFVLASVERFVNCPAIYADSSWHVYRTILSLSSNAITMSVDGYPLDSVDYSGAITGASTDSFNIGPFDTGVTIDGKIGCIKFTDGILSRGRSRAIYAYLRDTWGVASIPADGTATVVIYGAPSQGNLRRMPTLGAATFSEIDNQSGTTAISYCTRKDDPNEYIYYMEGGASICRLKRCGYAGDNITFVTTQQPTGNLAKGFAINLVAGEGYVTNGTNGNYMHKHSLDPADTADAWTQLINTGTYEMHNAVEYHAGNDLVYFIDSLAATPTLRSITPAGGSDTLVKSLTAGKVYTYLRLDDDNGVLYFVNQTDGTIEKYDIGTDTHTTAWCTPANEPLGLDYQSEKIWYCEDTTYKAFEVDISDGTTKTEIADLSGGVPGALGVRGLSVVVFDTTVV
jgi:hypothetical protein